MTGGATIEDVGLLEFFIHFSPDKTDLKLIGLYKV